MERFLHYIIKNVDRVDNNVNVCIKAMKGILLVDVCLLVITSIQNYQINELQNDVNRLNKKVKELEYSEGE